MTTKYSVFAWGLVGLLAACTGKMGGVTGPAVDGGVGDPGNDGGSGRGPNGDSSTDPGPDAATAPPEDAGVDPGFEPGPTGSPGGPWSTAPIVGCEGAERPARRDEGSVALCEAVGDGRCWFVSPDGDDANLGTFDAPFGTAQEAVKRVSPGDIIYLRGGVYDDRNAFDSRARSWGDESRGVERNFLRAGTVSLPAWAGGDNYDAVSGTAEAPITVRSFPGERACVSGAGSIGFGSIRAEIAYWRIENVTLHRGSIGVGGGSGSASAPRAQPHDIVISGNEVYEFTGNAGENKGLVRVNRGDGGGPYRITIESNILHDIYCRDTDGVTRGWDTMHDAQHYAAVTTLSCETYLGTDCGGNGELTVRNNHIYHVPQAFFLKNPALGPFNLVGNVIHDTRSLGKWSPSNITFENNLVYGGIGRISHGGSGGSMEDDGVYQRMAHNLVIRNNTFVGIRTLVQFRIYAAGHVITGNVFEGMRSMDERSYDNMGYVFQSHGWVQPDEEPRIASSQLATDNDFDDNCFVTADANFLAYGRRFDAGTTTELTHLSFEDARSTLSHELTSDVVATPEEAFVDASAGDYRSNPESACAGRGATPPTWAFL